MARSGRAGRTRAAGRGRTGWRRPGRGRYGPDELAVQLLPHLLAAGELPRAAVGDVLEVAPAIYAARVLPGRGRDRWADHWVQDELATVEAVGSMLAARLDPGGCPCWVDVLDVAGHLVPVNPAATPFDEEADDGIDEHGPGEVERVRVEGAMYLDPELGPGTPYGTAVALCRRRYRIGALRRYRRTLAEPVDPVPLATVPAPGAVSEDAVYVADLVALEPRAGGGSGQ